MSFWISQEFFFNFFPPGIPSDKLQYKGTLPLVHRLLQLQRLGLPLPCLWWLMSWDLRQAKYFVQAVFWLGDTNEEVRGRQQMFWEPWESQSRHQLLQRAHTALRPQTSVPGTRGNQCWRNGVGKDGSERTERLRRQPRQFPHREVQNLLLSACSLLCPCSRRSREVLPQQSYTPYLIKGIHYAVLAKKDQSQQLYEKRLICKILMLFI